MSLRQLVYSSFSNSDLSSSEVEAIVALSQERNARQSITGMLLYNGNQFIQFLEGDSDKLDRLYRRIQKDHRHHSVVTLVDRIPEQRLFSSWNMGFKDLHCAPQPVMQMMSLLAEREDVKNTSEKLASVLIIDDEIINLRLLDVILGKHYDLHAAVNGGEGLDIVQNHPIDLILLDVNMPEMSGFEVCAKLKSNPRFVEIPVVFISALNEAGHKVTGLGVGGIDYISKPFNTEEVKARVSLHLEMASLRADLKSGMAELMEKNKRLEMFARSLAHDLRNPLSTVKVYASMLESQSVDGEASAAEFADSFKEIQSASDHMEETIDSLLLLATSEREEIQLEQVDLHRLLGSCCDELASMIEEYGGDISIDQSLADCKAYAPWLKRVITNLLSNALKYGGRPPQIRLYTSTIVDGRINLSIHDNGRGLKDDEIAKLFNEYSRISPEMAPGIGLGLVIVKTLITLMNGSVSVKSSSDNGTRFIINLPSG